MFFFFLTVLFFLSNSRNISWSPIILYLVNKPDLHLMTEWHRLFKLWRNEYYTCLFLLICILIALFTAIKFHQKQKLHYFFYFYILSTLYLFSISDILAFIVFKLKHRPYTVFTETTNLCFAFIEYIIFYKFFSGVLQSKFAKKIMAFFILLLATAIIIFIFKSQEHTFSNPDMWNYSDKTISTELLFLGILCIIYYLELSKKKPVTDLLQSPSFWIVSGLFFLLPADSTFFYTFSEYASFY